jgi:hypothetical protein
MHPKTYKMILSTDYEKQLIPVKNEDTSNIKKVDKKEGASKVDLIVINWIENDTKL